MTMNFYHPKLSRMTEDNISKNINRIKPQKYKIRGRKLHWIFLKIVVQFWTETDSFQVTQ